MKIRYPFIVALLTISMGSFLMAVAPQDGPETQPPVMCHYDMSHQSEGGCSCAGQKHEKCGVDPKTRKLLRDNRMCAAYCDMSLCHCCIS